MKLLCTSLFFLFYLISYSQSCRYEFSKYGGLLYFDKKYEIGEGIPETYELLEIAQECLHCNINELQKAKMSNLIASIYYYYERDLDSTFKYFIKAYNYNAEFIKQTHVESSISYKTNSFISKYMYPYYLTLIEENKKFEKYLTFDETKYIEIYHSKKRKNNNSKVVANNKEYENKLKIIRNHDQKYRVEKFDKKQIIIDLNNRIKLDSLYNLYNFPTKVKVGSGQILTPWLVLQHSTDCDWNKKWLLRYLDAYSKGKIEAGLLPYTFERFYKPESGYCRKQNETEANDFIEYLLQKYPKEYAEIFGYKDYLVN